MIEAVVFEQAIATHQKNLAHLLEECAKEIEATYKSYATAHSDNQRAFEISKRDAAKKKEERALPETFEVRQKDYEGKMDNALAYFKDSEARIESETCESLKAILGRYSGLMKQEVESFCKALLPG